MSCIYVRMDTETLSLENKILCLLQPSIFLNTQNGLERYILTIQFIKV